MHNRVTMKSNSVCTISLRLNRIRVVRYVNDLSLHAKIMIKSLINFWNIKLFIFFRCVKAWAFRHTWNTLHMSLHLVSNHVTRVILSQRW